MVTIKAISPQAMSEGAWPNWVTKTAVCHPCVERPMWRDVDYKSDTCELDNLFIMRRPTSKAVTLSVKQFIITRQ